MVMYLIATCIKTLHFLYKGLKKYLKKEEDSKLEELRVSSGSYSPTYDTV